MCIHFLFVATQKLAGASVLVFANKQDLAGALPSKDIATTLELKVSRRDNHPCQYAMANNLFNLRQQ